MGNKTTVGSVGRDFTGRDRITQAEPKPAVCPDSGVERRGKLRGTELSVDTWIVVISGFLQNKGEPNGITRIWRQLHAKMTDSTSVVYHLTWDSDIKATAEFMFRYSNRHQRPKILLAGYSWGGQTAANLAFELDRRGLHVDQFVTADAVHRHKYWFGRWRAMVPWSKIRIPDSVKRVTWFRQKMNKPAGHQLVGKNVGDPIELHVAHQYADDAVVVENTILKLAEEL